MTKNQHIQENHRWFTSELLFVTAADMVRCVIEIRDLIGPSERLDVSPAETGIHLDGYFDLIDKLDQIQEIIKKYASFAMQQYSIKCILITQDGHFDGWCEKYNRHGEIIEGINLSDFFEEGENPNATK